MVLNNELCRAKSETPRTGFLLTVTINSDGYYVIIAGEHDKTAPNNFNMTEGLVQIVFVDDVIMVGKAKS